MTDSLPTHLCKECGRPASVYFQPFCRAVGSGDVFNGQVGYFAATCINRQCDFYGVTLSPQNHEALTETEREAYRQQRRKQRAEGR